MALEKFIKKFTQGPRIYWMPLLVAAGFALTCVPPTAARPRHPAPARPMQRHVPSRRTKMLAQKIKQIADRIRDPHATVRSVAGPLGTWHHEEGDPQCDLVLQDKDFTDGTLSLLPAAGSHLPVEARQPELMYLTLAKDAVLTVTDLEHLFGKPHPVPPPPSGHPYSVAFYSPDSHTLLSTAVFARLNGPPEKSTTHVTSLLLRRDDARAVTTDRAADK